MLGEQLKLLFTLYVTPVRAASRIIDRGRIWFAVVAALIVTFAIPPGLFVPPSATPQILTEGPPPVSLLATLMAAIDPASMVRTIGSAALAMVPAIILVITIYRSHESFPVTLRKDYLTLLNCVLLSLAAAFLPLVILSRILVFGWYSLALAIFAALELYFIVLIACSVRTLWGAGPAVATIAAVIGMAAMFAGMIAFGLLGRFMYFLASPFLLYYAYILLGSDMRSLGEGLRARQHLRQQLEFATLNPRDSDAQYQLGLIYQQRHQYDEAKRRFAHAAEIDPREADPVFQLGRIALEEQRLSDAIELLTRAAALDDKCCSHEVWRDLGVAYLHSGRLEDARLALATFVDRRPYDPEGLYWYGKTLLALGRNAEAKQQFEQCCEAVDTMPANRRRQLAKWKRLAAAELRGI